MSNPNKESGASQNQASGAEYVEHNEARARELEVPLMIVEQKVDHIEQTLQIMQESNKVETIKQLSKEIQCNPQRFFPKMH